MHLGSGNLTSGGLGKNHELFSTFTTNKREDPQFSIIKAGVSYLKSFLKNKTGFVQQQLGWISQHCTLVQNFNPPTNSMQVLLNDGTQVSFLANGRVSIYNQLNRIIPNNEIEEIKIVSPFFDDNGLLIKKFKEDFKNANVKILVQEGKTCLPKDIASFERIKLFDWNETERAKKRFKSGERFNHSKVFIFKSPSETYILHGSPNATASGFGIHQYFVNDEAALLFKFNNVLERHTLGLSSNKELDAKTLKKHNYLPNPERAINYSKSSIKILGADKNLKDIRINFSKSIEKNQVINFLDASGKVIKGIEGSKYCSREIQLSIEVFPEIQNAVALYVSQGESKVSKHAFINDLEYLWKCNPSKENRKIQKLISNIQIGNISEFDIVNHLTSIIKSQEQSGIKKPASRSIKPGQQTAIDDVSYQEAKSLNENEKHESHMLNSPKQLWDALNVLLKFFKTANEEKSIDQEEEGAKDDGGDVDEDKKNLYSKTKSFNSSKALERVRKRLIQSFDKYLAYLKHLFGKKDYKISSSDLCYFLVLYYQLIFIANKKYNLKLSGKQKKGKVLLPLNGLIKELKSFNSISIRVVGHFLLLLNKFEHIEYDDEFSVQEFNVYKKQCSVLIYFALSIHSKINNHKRSDWWSLLWINCSSSLSGFNQKSFEKLIDSFDDLVHFEMEDLEEEVKSIIAESAQIKSNTYQNIDLKKYIYLNQFGTSEIIRKIPSSNPKSIELSFPGINFDKNKNNFVYPFFYNFNQEDFLKVFRK